VFPVSEIAQILFAFYLHDVQFWQWPNVCLCLVTSRYFVVMVSEIKVVFSMEAFFHLPHSVLKGNLGISSDKGIYFWNYNPNSGLFAMASQLSQHVVNLVCRRWLLSVIN